VTTLTYAATRNGYANLWARVQLKPERRAAAVAIARRLLTHRARYEAAASAVGCPWWWVAVVHNLESGGSWTSHLHNGDPLTRRTTHVPAGRPATGSPPFTWEESARDALRLKNLQSVPTWEIPRCLYEWERYNGFGYVARRVNSPYVWSFTTLQQPGKYVADGVFDRNEVSQQCGAAAVLLALIEIGAVQGVTTEGEQGMTELASSIQPFAGLVPNLVRVIAGPLPSLAVRALAEALDTPATAPEVKQKLEDTPISGLIAALQRAEEIVGMLTPPEPTPPPVRAEEPAGDPFSREAVSDLLDKLKADGHVVVAPAAPVNLDAGQKAVVQPVEPPALGIDRFIPKGFKTIIGILVYAAGVILPLLGYVTADTGLVIQTAGGAWVTITVKLMLDRWLPVFAGFLKVRKGIV